MVRGRVDAVAVSVSEQPAGTSRSGPGPPAMIRVFAVPLLDRSVTAEPFASSSLPMVCAAGTFTGTAPTPSKSITSVVAGLSRSGSQLKGSPQLTMSPKPVHA